MQDIASLDWSMRLINGGKTLRLEYAVTSRAKERFYLSDLLPIPGAKTFRLGTKSIIVMNGDQPDTVAFVRARVASEAPILVPLDPGARAIDPGQTLKGEAEVSLPLQAQHYQGTVAPLNRSPKYAILEIGYIVGNAHWTALTLDDGTTLTVSNPVDPMQIIRSDRKPIPTQ